MNEEQIMKRKLEENEEHKTIDGILYTKDKDGIFRAGSLELQYSILRELQKQRTLFAIGVIFLFGIFCLVIGYGIKYFGGN